MYVGFQAKLLFFLPHFNQNWTFSTDFTNTSKTKFDENPSSGSQVVSRGRTDGGTDMTKLIASFGNFAKAPSKFPVQIIAE